MSLIKSDNKSEQDDDKRNPNKNARPARVPIRPGTNLDYPEAKLDREKFAYRWFLDHSSRPGRIQQAKAAYWEHKQEDGVNVQRPAGAGQQFLMQLPMEYWQEDQELKRQRNRANMAQDNEIGENEYAPDSQGRSEGGTTARTSVSGGNPFDT